LTDSIGKVNVTAYDENGGVVAHSEKLAGTEGSDVRVDFDLTEDPFNPSKVEYLSVVINPPVVSKIERQVERVRLPAVLRFDDDDKRLTAVGFICITLILSSIIFWVGIDSWHRQTHGKSPIQEQSKTIYGDEK
jgi:hypothetical protein